MTTTNKYEAIVLIKGSLKPSLLKAAQERVEKEMANAGKVTDRDTWAARPLAYKIGQEVSGTYEIFVFDAETPKIAELNQTLRLDTDVIRYMIVRTPKEYVFKKMTAEDLEWDFRKVVMAPRKPGAGDETEKRRRDTRGSSSSRPQSGGGARRNSK